MLGHWACRQGLPTQILWNPIHCSSYGTVVLYEYGRPCSRGGHSWPCLQVLQYYHTERTMLLKSIQVVMLKGE